jgi:MoxR-like ATPase
LSISTAEATDGKILNLFIRGEELIKWQEMVDSVTIHAELVDYIVTLVRATRENPYILQGASPGPESSFQGLPAPFPL